jgi:hypothetical protein
MEINENQWELCPDRDGQRESMGINGNSVPNWTKVMERNGYCGLEATLEFTSNGVRRPTGSSTVLRPWNPWALLKVYRREFELDFDVSSASHIYPVKVCKRCNTGVLSRISVVNQPEPNCGAYLSNIGVFVISFFN